MSEKLSQDEFAKVWVREGCSPRRVAKVTGLEITGVYARRARLAKRGIYLPTMPQSNNNSKGANGFGETNWAIAAPAYNPRLNLTIRNGSIVAFSDAHIWPGIRSLATDALFVVLKALKPKIVIANGDVLDGASISRHDPLGWVKTPKVIEELDAVKTFMAEVVRATPNAEHIFTAGNHDSRFDRRLAMEVAEFEDVPGMRLQDHLSDWTFCYAALVNEDTEPSYFLHAHRGGVHAPRNNVLASGCTTFTGHLHSQKTMPVTTLLSELDGVDCGMLADRDGPQFAYIASRPTDWREGFAVQAYDKDGYRAPAELARVKYFKKDRRCYFRGEVIASRQIKRG